jgi:hypothetical protein
MKIIKKETIMVDVDSTLVMWPKLYHEERSGSIKANYYGTPIYVNPHTYHIDLVKAYYSRGFRIIVHSANGWEWALEIVKKLELENYIHEVSTKFVKYIDDKPADEWTKRIYIDTMEHEDINA